jgi:small subunit ribosomal protein S10e
MSFIIKLIERPEGAYRPRGDREDYRRRDDGEKKEGASGDYKPALRSGLGRGRPAQQ